MQNNNHELNSKLLEKNPVKRKSDEVFNENELENEVGKKNKKRKTETNNSTKRTDISYSFNLNEQIFKDSKQRKIDLDKIYQSFSNGYKNLKPLCTKSYKDKDGKEITKTDFNELNLYFLNNLEKYYPEHMDKIKDNIKNAPFLINVLAFKVLAENDPNYKKKWKKGMLYGSGKRHGKNYMFEHEGVTFTVRLDKTNEKFNPRVSLAGTDDKKTIELADMLDQVEDQYKDLFISAFKGETRPEYVFDEESRAYEVFNEGLEARLTVLISDAFDYAGNSAVTEHLLENATKDNYRILFLGDKHEGSYGALPSQNQNPKHEDQSDRLSAYKVFGEFISTKSCTKSAAKSNVFALRKFRSFAQILPNSIKIEMEENGKKIDDFNFDKNVRIYILEDRETKNEQYFDHYEIFSDVEENSEDEKEKYSVLDNDQRQKRIDKLKKKRETLDRKIRLLETGMQDETNSNIDHNHKKNSTDISQKNSKNTPEKSVKKQKLSSKNQKKEGSFQQGIPIIGKHDIEMSITPNPGYDNKDTVMDEYNNNNPKANIKNIFTPDIYQERVALFESIIDSSNDMIPIPDDDHRKAIIKAAKKEARELLSKDLTMEWEYFRPTFERIINTHRSNQNSEFDETVDNSAELNNNNQGEYEISYGNMLYDNSFVYSNNDDGRYDNNDTTMTDANINTDINNNNIEYNIPKPEENTKTIEGTITKLKKLYADILPDNITQSEIDEILKNNIQITPEELNDKAINRLNAIEDKSWELAETYRKSNLEILTPIYWQEVIQQCNRLSITTNKHDDSENMGNNSNSNTSTKDIDKNNSYSEQISLKVENLPPNSNKNVHEENNNNFEHALDTSKGTDKYNSDYGAPTGNVFNMSSWGQSAINNQGKIDITPNTETHNSSYNLGPKI